MTSMAARSRDARQGTVSGTHGHENSADLGLRNHRDHESLSGVGSEIYDTRQVVTHGMQIPQTVRDAIVDVLQAYRADVAVHTHPELARVHRRLTTHHFKMRIE